MLNYMRGLRQTFYKEPVCTELNETIDELHRKLSERMSREDRRQLLQLVDLMIELQDNISLASFIAGFRLSNGIATELSSEEGYSFEKEDEERARKPKM